MDGVSSGRYQRKDRNSNKKYRPRTRKNAVKAAFSIKCTNKQEKVEFGPEKSKIATQAKSAKKEERNTKAEDICSKTRGKRTLQTKPSQEQQRKEAQKGRPGGVSATWPKEECVVVRMTDTAENVRQSKLAERATPYVLNAVGADVSGCNHWAMDVIMPRRKVQDGSRSCHGRSSELLKPIIIGSVRSVQEEPQISDVIGKDMLKEKINGRSTWCSDVIGTDVIRC